MSLRKLVEGARWLSAAFHEWRYFSTSIVKTLAPAVHDQPDRDGGVHREHAAREHWPLEHWWQHERAKRVCTGQFAHTRQNQVEQDQIEKCCCLDTPWCAR